MLRSARKARLLREPLVHFALLGAVVFGLHHAFAPATARDDDAIARDARFLEGLRASRRAAGDTASDAEIEEAWLREEALVGEARRLGLHRGDPVIRRRLVEKMELLLEASAEVPEPTDAELEAALERDAARYALPSRVTFEHVFFRSARDDAEGDARRALASGEREGDPFLLGRRVAGRTFEAIEGQLGPGLASALRTAPLDAWSGPFESSYGWHLVRVTERAEATRPTLADVRGRVRADLERERRAAAVREAARALVEARRAARE